MRIESVTAHAFGPFRGETLELGKGMTVVYGPNESGKSTWHAALYAALCGVRRGRGQRSEDRDFRDRHRPWDGSEWEVSALIRLEDGRRVEMRHDLDGRVDCEARDADLGREYTSEIINDGAPDASRWLGLDRKSFLGTACVRQADIQAVVDQANALQEHLQRAAATAGTDSTAAAALDRLKEFQRDNVGADDRRSTRPLRSARQRLEQAQSQLEEATGAHQEYLRQMEKVEQLEKELAGAQEKLQLAEAARARLIARELERKAKKAREFVDKYPTEPPDPSELKRKAQTVTRALDRWDNQPASIEVSAPSSEELSTQIQELPPEPEGDTRPHEGVVQAKDAVRASQTNLEAHGGRRPTEPENVETGGLQPQQLRNLADDLSLEEPEIDPVTQERLNRARAKLDELESPQREASGSKPASPLIRPFILLFRFLVKVVRSLFGLGKPSVDYAATARASEELRQAETELGEVQYRLNDVRQRRRAAQEAVKERGLPADPTELNELAYRVERSMEASSELRRWQAEEERLRQEHDRTAALLKQALQMRGVLVETSVSEAFEAYEDGCEQRDQQARQASRRPHLEQLYESRKQQEAAAAEADRGRREASRLLADAAGSAGVSGDTEEEVAERLRDWADGAERTAQEQELAKAEWEELQTLLDGQTVATLEDTAARRRREAERLGQGLDSESIAQVDLGDDVDSLLGRLRQAAGGAESALAEKRGSLDQFAKNVPSVAEAEEQLAKAEAELSRVKTLDQTLTKTQEFLRVAQERVHRDLAPVLREALAPWLRTVTGDRYHDLRIDVETLRVYVSGEGRKWREVGLLSHGTAEQIYLLLRVAMSRHLTAEGESCPLILDDVTVHCDPERQHQILSLLHEISKSQQVIVFSQEPETLAWAETHLLSPDDCLVRADASGIPA